MLRWADCACFSARLIMFQGQCVFQCMVNRVSGIAYVSVLGYLCFRDCACFSAWLCFRDCACFSAWLIVFQGLFLFQCLVNRVSGIVRVSMLG